MSSSRGQSYWCYQCARTIRPVVGADIICPHCNGGFVEEMESPTSNIGEGSRGNIDALGGHGGFQPWQGSRHALMTGDQTLAQMMEYLAALFQQGAGNNNSSNIDFNQEGEGGGGGGGGAGSRRARRGMDPGGFNPIMLLQGQMESLISGAGGNLDVFYDNGTGTGPSRLPGNLGDYFLGPGLDQLIQHLAENDPNRYGTPPASKSSIEAMPTIQISGEHLGTDSAQCAVCKDEFAVGADVKQMPCKHMYHSDCILPWLAQHNSCPVCRYEMPTDDAEYDRARSRGQTSNWTGNSRGGTEGQAGNPGGFSLWGASGGRFAMGGVNNTTNESIRPEASSGNTAAGGTSAPNQQQYPGMFSARPVNIDNSGGDSGGGAGRRFRVSFPWPPRAFSSTTQQAQAETSSGPANSGETVSSRPNEGYDVQGSNLGAVRTDDDGDTVMSEAREGELD